MKNAERVVRTRAALLVSARKLFAVKPFAEVSTEAVLAGAGVTRGALYHHFADKAALFEAVCRELSEEAMAAIERSVGRVADPVKVLEKGSLAWLDFMLRPEVRRILLVEAPTVLGWPRWVAMDEAHSFKLLRSGVEEALRAGALRFAGGAEALAVVINGALNALALRLGDGTLSPTAGRRAVKELIGAFIPSPS
jgi:AcrR family transcriptional regulator